MRIGNTAGFLFYLGGWNTPIWDRKLTLNDYITIFLVSKQPGYANDTRWSDITAYRWKPCSSILMGIFPLSWVQLVNWNAEAISNTISPTVIVLSNIKPVWLLSHIWYVYYIYIKIENIPKFEGFFLPKQQAISNLLPATANWDIWRATIQLRTIIYYPISRKTTTWCCLFEDFKGSRVCGNSIDKIQ